MLSILNHIHKNQLRASYFTMILTTTNQYTYFLLKMCCIHFANIVNTKSALNFPFK